MKKFEQVFCKVTAKFQERKRLLSRAHENEFIFRKHGTLKFQINELLHRSIPGWISKEIFQRNSIEVPKGTLDEIPERIHAAVSGKNICKISWWHFALIAVGIAKLNFE